MTGKRPHQEAPPTGKKDVRHRNLAAHILDKGYIPPHTELADRFHVSERTIRRDLKELADLIPDEAVQDIKTSLMLTLKDRIPDMEDHNLIKLVEFFLAKKLRTVQEIEGRLEVRKEVDVSAALEEYGPTLAKLMLEEEKRRSQAGDLPRGNSQPQSLEHPEEEKVPRESGHGDPPLDECPRCGGIPVYDEALGAWLCSKCSAPLKLLAKRYPARQNRLP